MNAQGDFEAAFPVPGLSNLPNGEFIYPERGMNLRQYAAIHLRVPDSGLDWLDKMIKKANGEDGGTTWTSMMVRRSSPEYSEYISERFRDGAIYDTFMFQGHRWRYRCTSFDDEGEFDIIERPTKGEEEQ